MDSWPQELLVALRCAAEEAAAEAETVAFSMSWQRRSVEAVGEVVACCRGDSEATTGRWPNWELIRMAGAELDNWKSSSKLLALASVAGSPRPQPGFSGFGGAASGEEGAGPAKSIRLFECECSCTIELLQLQLRGRSFVASGEIWGKCCSCCRFSRSSPSSQLSMRRMVST